MNNILIPHFSIGFEHILAIKQIILNKNHHPNRHFICRHIMTKKEKKKKKRERGENMELWHVE